jgi:polyphosphate kinase 2 (PPK2 family)
MLETVDLTRALDRDAYVRELTRRQIQLRELGYQIYLQKRPVVLVFEGWDAAGKGGAIKRFTEKLDPRGYVVYSIAAPQGEDKTRHYLYRFWRRLPERGQIAIFDRSWYGRVLVERVEGFAAEEAWKRAFKEINSFERQLRDFGTIMAKFWIHVSSEEQLRRFEERQGSEYKAWKLTDEDWRNRQKWPLYEEAVEEMLVKTSTQHAPWRLVEGNDKNWARVKVLASMVEVLSRELDYQPADPLKHGGKKAAKAAKAAKPAKTPPAKK